MTCQPLAILARTGGVGSPIPVFPAPNSLPNIELWLQSDDIALGGGSPVTTWADKSANANNFTQGTAANRPTYTSNALNGHAVVTFDGTNDFLAGTNANLTGNDFTFFAVFSRANSAASHVLFEVGNVAPDLDNNKSLGQANASDSFDLCSRNWNCVNSSTTFVPSAYSILIITYSLTASGAYSVRRNGTVTASGTNMLNGFETIGTAALASVPDIPGGSTVWNGTVAEVGYYSRILSGTEIQSLQCYLSTRYGITLAVSC